MQSDIQQATLAPLQLEEVPQLASIARKTFYETFIPYNSEEDIQAYLEKSFSIPQLQSEFTEDGNAFYLAKLAGEIVGYVKLQHRIPKPDPGIPQIIYQRNAVLLERIYLDSRCHGTGVAHHMMQTCLDIAVARGHDLIWLGVWENNHRARRFYEKWGFQVIGPHPFVIGNQVQTDYWMAKSLVPA